MRILVGDAVYVMPSTRARGVERLVEIIGVDVSNVWPRPDLKVEICELMIVASFAARLGYRSVMAG
jgi:hypothetical protein